MAQLTFDLRRTSALLFDWTDGQAALGQVRVFHDAKRVPEAGGFQPWYDAHVRMYATNRLRPWAAQGGIVDKALADPQKPALVYEPGQVNLGAVWNRYGEAGGNLGEDWPRTLAHELGHYLFYMDDNYLGLDANNVLIPIDTCPGAMADPYRDDYSEFHPAAGWLPACARTLSQLETGRSDWATLRTFYPELTMPAGFGSQPGPRSLPLAVTHITTIEPDAASRTLDVPIFYLSDQNGASTAAGNSARAFLLQGDWLTDLGRPTAGEVAARGARAGDGLCVFEPELDRLGCETVTPSDDQLRLAPNTDWQPQIRVSPVTSRTINLRVDSAPAGLTLGARLFPAETSALPAMPLKADANGYNGVFRLADPALEGHLYVFDAFALRLEAEGGALAAPMTAADLGGACGGKYVFTPQANSATARVNLTVDIPVTGGYYLWARAMGIDYAQNSFLVAVDDGPQAPFHVLPPDPTVTLWPWGWTRVDGDVNSELNLGPDASAGRSRRIYLPWARFPGAQAAPTATRTPTALSVSTATRTSTATVTATITRTPTATWTPTRTPTGTPPPPTATPGPPSTAIVAPRANTRPIIDGNLVEWGGLSAALLTQDTASAIAGATPSLADLSAQLRAAWAPDMLFFAAAISDDVLVGNNSTQIWGDDAIELSIRVPQNNQTHQLTLAVDGRAAANAAPITSLTYFTRTIPGGWAFEVGVLAAVLGLSGLAADQQYPFTFALWDDDLFTYPGQTHMFWRSNNTSTYKSDWGILKLNNATYNLP